MKLALKNGAISIAVDTQGAQLTSIQDENGLEYLWQGNPEYWAGQAPPLFPIVGGLRNQRAIMPNGKECRLPRHGLARRQTYRPIASGDDFITLSAQADEQTLQAFPYPYELHLTYRINKKSVTTQFTVINTGHETMPFFLGGHPAFNCPLAPEEKFEDYVVEFDEPETAYCMTTDVSTGLLRADERIHLLDNRRTLPMRHTLFSVDSIPFDSLRSRGAKLYNPASGHGVRMDFIGFDYFVVWSARNSAPFVALEPWTGLATCSDEDDVFIHKRGVHALASGETFELSYCVTLLDR